MDQIITFDKSYQQRFQEYMDVLSGYEILSANQVRKEWGFYLELVADPNGWQAVWKIPRGVCERLKILYPSIVLVYVENVSFADLAAFVKILAVQDEIHLPEAHVVPLIQLWPTRHQDETLTGLNVDATANAIDMLHFFYNHLWMPWDGDDEENVDWITKHLEVRLRLYYDVKMGVVPRSMAERYRSLVSEAKGLQAKREQLEEELSDEDDIDVDLDFSRDNKITLNESVQTLTNLHIRITQIKSEVEILENPVLRTVLLQKKAPVEEDADDSEFPQNWLILKSGLTVDDYIGYMRKVKDSLPAETTFKTATNLQAALESSKPKDVVIVPPGQHRVHSVCSLEEGGTIKSLEPDVSELISQNENIMLDFSGDVVLENLHVNVHNSQCGILVRKGRVRIHHCTITGKGDSSIHQAIIVLPDAELYIENSTITNFATGIVSNSNSKINVQNVTVSDVEIGIKLYNESHANIHQSTFSVCKQYGIYVERDVDLEESVMGDLDTLETVPNVNAADCTFSSNGKGDVYITKIQRILPVRDLFSKPKSPTSSVEFEDEKENMEM